MNNAYNMSFLSNHDVGGGLPPSRGIIGGTRKMMAAVASGAIDETSPHSSKHDLLHGNSGMLGGNSNLTHNNGGGIHNGLMYRKRF